WYSNTSTVTRATTKRVMTRARPCSLPRDRLTPRHALYCLVLTATSHRERHSGNKRPFVLLGIAQRQRQAHLARQRTLCTATEGPLLIILADVVVGNLQPHCQVCQLQLRGTFGALNLFS